MVVSGQRWIQEGAKPLVQPPSFSGSAKGLAIEHDLYNLGHKQYSLLLILLLTKIR